MPVRLHDRVQWAITPLRPGTHWGPKAHNMSLAPTASAVPCDVSKGILNGDYERLRLPLPRRRSESRHAVSGNPSFRPRAPRLEPIR